MEKGATASRKQVRAVASRVVSIKGIFIVILAACATSLPLHAQVTNASDRITGGLTSEPAGIWVDDVVGNGFCRGVNESGFAVGGGAAAPHVGDKRSHDLVLSRFYYGWMFGGVKARDKWYRGNWEVLEEGFVGAQVYPASRYVIGETTLLRYSLATGTRWVPFFDAGIGISATDIANPDLGTIFEFNGQVGPGVNFFWRRNRAITFQYRFTHISNADIRSPNQGVNEHMFYAGMTWYF